MVTFVHSGDLHLGSDFSSFDLRRADFLKKSLRQSFIDLIDYCRNNKTDLLFLSGDIFDSPSPTDDSLNFFKQALSRLNGTKVFIALGNHDYGVEVSGENIHVFSTDGENLYIPDLNLQVSGRSFSARYEPISIIDNLTPKNGIPSVLCIHGDLDGKDYNPVSRRKLEEKGFSYCALGHIHTYSAETLGHSIVCYSGCLMGRGFDEQGQKGFISGKIHENGSVNMQFIPSSAPFFSEITTDSDDLDALKLNLSPSGIYKINISGSDLSAETIEKLLEENAFFCKVCKTDTASGLFTDILKQELADYPEALSYALMALNGRSCEI